MLSVEHGGIKYHFLNLWYDTTWYWTRCLWRTLYSLGQSWEWECLIKICILKIMVEIIRMNLPESSELLRQKLELGVRNLELVRRWKREILVLLRWQKIPDKQLQSSKQNSPKIKKKKHFPFMSNIWNQFLNKNCLFFCFCFFVFSLFCFCLVFVLIFSWGLTYNPCVAQTRGKNNYYLLNPLHHISMKISTILIWHLSPKFSATKHREIYRIFSATKKLLRTHRTNYIHRKTEIRCVKII